MPFFDMHCHLDFAANAAEAAAQIDALGAGVFAVRVLPAEPGEEDLGAGESLVRWGVGLHPWWVADGRAGDVELARACGQIAKTRFVGEIGLDFGKTHGMRREEQLRAFDELCRACAESGDKVISLHAVAAADELLDVLERHGLAESCACILHWYSGSSDALARAIRLGCFFSVGEPMLQSKRGREYARQIPDELLLLETDLPPVGEPYPVDAVQEQLGATLRAIADLRGCGPEALADTVEATSRRLLA